MCIRIVRLFAPRYDRVSLNQVMVEQYHQYLHPDCLFLGSGDVVCLFCLMGSVCQSCAIASVGRIDCGVRRACACMHAYMRLCPNVHPCVRCVRRCGLCVCTRLACAVHLHFRAHMTLCAAYTPLVYEVHAYTIVRTCTCTLVVCIQA
jgi:hypothetical protein